MDTPLIGSAEIKNWKENDCKYNLLNQGLFTASAIRPCASSQQHDTTQKYFGFWILPLLENGFSLALKV